MYSLYSCKDLNTSASYPLVVVDYRCLDGLDNFKDHKTEDLLISNDKLYVAKGRRGIEVYSLKHTNQPISNSITISRDSGYFAITSSLAAGHNLIFAINHKTLTVLKPSDGDITVLTRIDTENFSNKITVIHVDKYLPYIYIGLEGKGLIAYSTKDLSIKYDYSNSIKDVKSIYSTKDSIYLMNNDKNSSLDIYRKTFIGDNLRINKVKTHTNLQDIRILSIINNKLSYINETNNSVGVYNLSLDNDDIIPYFSIEHNDSILPQKLRNINDFYYDGFYKIISSDYGLTIIDDDGNTYKDLTFYSDKMVVYNDFIISTDDVEENATNPIDVMGRAAKNSSAIRIYKFGDIFVSKNYGKAPLKVRFHIRSLNLKQVSWDFNPLELPSYEKSPEYTYEQHGDYNVTSTITHKSGEITKESIPIKVIEDKKIDIHLSVSATTGNAPFNLKMKLDDTDIKLIKSISWDIIGESTPVQRRVTSLDYTFVNEGNYTVQVIAEDFEGNRVEKNTSISVKGYFKPTIVLDLNRTYMSKDINFSLEYKDSPTDTNISSKRKITNYKWVFHDGSFSYQKNAVYNYPKAGIYVISAILKDEYGLSYEVNETVEVSSNILPNIIVEKKIGESPLTSIFYLKLENTYKRHISDLTWNLPNGSSSKSGSVAYTFNNEGEFKIRNRYTLSDGFSGIKDVYIKIDNTVESNITSSINYGFAPLKVDFSINGSANSGIKSYDLDFDDGNKTNLEANQTSFSYTFNKAKLYKVKLTSNSNKNHTGVSIKNIYAIDVNLSYKAIETNLDKIAQSKDFKVQFQADITNKAFVKSYQWIYGFNSDKSDINISNPIYTYKYDKQYKAQLEITLKDNQTIRKEIIVEHPTNKNNIFLYNGWNLISNPLSTPLVENCSSSSCIKMSKLEEHIVTYIFKENKWIKNPKEIASKHGIWIKVNRNKGLSFYGNRFKLNTDNLVTKTWHLIGSGEDLSSSDLSSFRALYVFDGKYQKYTKNPTSIKATQGFYGIK